MTGFRQRRRPDRRRTRLRPVGAILFGVCSVLVACGDDSPAEATVTVSDAWALATPPGTTVAAAYVTMRASTDDALVGASVDTDVAASADLHTTTTADGSGTAMSSMDHMASLALSSDDDVTLDPGGSHVMLVDLAAPLGAGSSFEL